MQDFLNNTTSNFKNIWRYQEFYPHTFSAEEKLYIDDSFTPIEKSEYIPNIDLYLKREDKSETGSLKSRGVGYQISIAKQSNVKNFVIPTSGNAGITASLYLKKYGGNVIVVTSDSIPEKKFFTLQEKCKYLLISKNPIHTAAYISKKYDFYNLRPSKDDNSIYGYYSIGFEIFEQLNKLPDNIFIYSTSGSSFIGIYESLLILRKYNLIKSIPKMFAVRKEGIRTFRLNEVSEICTKTNGEIIEVTPEQFDSENFETSFEGRSALYAVRTKNPTGTTMAILTGSRYKDSLNFQNKITRIENLDDVDCYMKQNFLGLKT
jgi:threonine synthase